MDTLGCKVFKIQFLEVKKMQEISLHTKCMSHSKNRSPLLNFLGEYFEYFKLSKVHAYDPTVSFPPLRGNSISFQKLGVAAKRSRMPLSSVDAMRSKSNMRIDFVTRFMRQ